MAASPYDRRKKTPLAARDDVRIQAVDRARVASSVQRQVTGRETAVQAAARAMNQPGRSGAPDGNLFPGNQHPEHPQPPRVDIEFQAPQGSSAAPGHVEHGKPYEVLENGQQNLRLNLQQGNERNGEMYKVASTSDGREEHVYEGGRKVVLPKSSSAFLKRLAAKRAKG